MDPYTHSPAPTEEPPPARGGGGDHPLEAPDLVAQLSPLQRRVLTLRRGARTPTVVGLLTAFACSVSVLATFVVNGLIVGDRGSPLYVGLAEAFAIPAVLTPLMTLYIIRLYGLIIDAHDALDRLASTDALTGLRNRRAFFTLATDALARRGPGELVVLMVDADRFKEINDRHGHAVGDDALRRLAGGVRAALPPDAVLGRVGGDEFAAVVALSRGRVDSAVDAVREACREVSVAPGVVFGASVGAAIVEAGDSVDSALERADRRMYRAKGREPGGGSPVRHRR
ncbi:MAG: GGDEF domain-containing protein [Thermoleophilia bacterium]|nr:GGDEF domain-containing protein [Thermoleophilia bacterium]